MSCEEARRAGGLAISGAVGVYRRSGARAMFLDGPELLQLLQVVATTGQFGYRLPELALADLFFCLGADQLP